MASQADEAPAPQTSIGEGDLKDHVHDELNKRQRQGSTTTVFPEPLRESDDSADEDNGPTQAPPMFMNMNQSIYGLIAQASSRVDFNDRFDGMSSDEEGEGSQQNAKENIAQTSILQPTGKGKEKANRRRKLSDHKLLRSLPALPKLRSRHKSQTSRLSAPVEDADEADNEGDSSGGLLPPPSISRQDTQGRLAPVMSRMLEAKADLSSRPSFDLDRLSSDVSRSSDGDEASALSKKLKEIFEFDEYEQVIEEYPCWLLQSVLLQGYMYITSKHICFYAYLPKKAHEAVKSGYLSKSGKRNPSYARFWFRLKGDVLTYYKTATDVYFPHGQIDLRYGISASIVDKDKEGLHFVVETHSRTYKFKADSAPSAKEWVKSLQRVIFRSHNDGDSVKISLPIKNVMDIEDTQMIAFADTCKIRVIDNDETYAIDEYFFSFFSFGKEAINVLRILIESSSESRSDEKAESGDKDHHGSKSASGRPSRASSKHRTSKLHTGKLSDTVKATLSPMSPVSPRSPGQLSPRVSMDAARSSFDGFRRFGRKSMDVPSSVGDHSPRRSFSGTRRSTSFQHRQGTTTPKQAHDSEDSFLQSSVENPSISTLSPSSYDEPSASQILQGSDVFHSPMMRRSASASRKRDRSGKRTPRNSSAHGERHPGVPHAATTGSLQEMGGEQGDSQRPTTPTLNSITKIGAYPLQRANAFAEYLSRTSQRMGSMFATESLGYVEKVHGMWKGEHRHYDEPRELRTDDDGEDIDSETDDKMQTTVDRFRAHFALPDSEKLVATYFGAIFKVLPLYGKFYISDRSFCFRSLYPGTRTKLILPLKDIENVHKEKGFRLGYSGLTVVIRGHEELFFEFKRQDLRDDCAVTLHQLMETNRFLQQSGVLDQEEQEDEEAAAAIAERDALKEARQDEFVDHELALPRETSGVSNAPTILFDNPNASGLAFKPQKSMKITCLTIGSRGDVQPYIALCKGLLAEGHKPRIATHAEFQGWIESHGIEFARVEGDPGELMRLCIENGTFTWAFLREANSTFRGWLDDLLDSAYTACEGSELLIESPSAMAGIHIAEKLGIPYFRAFTMPWTRTRAYPHAFIMPEHKMGGAYNYMTYVMFDNIFWKATAYQVNRWRNKTLGLPSTSLEKMQPNKVPFLYNFSPSVVAPPLDFSDWIRVTGYWFLDEGGSDWQPPQELQDFITKAKADGKKIVYVGFGSIIVKDPAKMTQEVIDAVLKADVRCILSKGWSDRISPKEDPSKPRPDEPEMPPEIHVIKSAPHDWLFSQIDAAAHHGGSGTTGASLRAGIPTIIRPFFGDQFFFATRVEDLGVGVWVKKWGTNSFGRALWEVTRNERMIVKARVLGEQIRSESGVDNAIQCIYRDMEYAKSLIKRKAGKNNAQHDPVEDDDTEESWTFVGRDEPDPDAVTKKLSEGLVGLGAASDRPLPLGSQAPTVA